MMRSQVRTEVHVHVKLPSRQDAQPQVPWRHNVGGAECGAHTNTDTQTRDAQKHRHRIDREEERGGGTKVVKERAEEGPLTFTDLARANV